MVRSRSQRFAVLAVALGLLAGTPLVASDEHEGREPATEEPALPGPHAPTAIVAAQVILAEGDTADGSVVDTLNAPFTNGLGEPGFVGSFVGGERFVWSGAGVLFRASDVVGPVLTGGESTMGIGDAGQFIYSPSVDGDDAVWTQNGLLLADGTQAPGFPAGVTNTFNSRPQLLPSGRALWVSGFNETGGTTTQGRMLYSSSDGTPGNTVVVLRSDDLVGGFPIDRPSGIGFDYQLSDNGAHHIHQLILDTGSTANDDVIYVDGAVVARESQPTGQGDNWAGLDVVTIGNFGHYAFSGDTSGATATDEFIAYDGAIVLREGTALDGVTLGTAVQALSLNNVPLAAFIWNLVGGTEALFVGCDPANLAASSTRLLTTGDELDIDGDGGGDGLFVDDFNASTVIGPGLWLAEDGRVFVEVDLTDGEVTWEAILGLDLPVCALPDIDPTPLALASLQPPDTVVVLPLDLANLGGATLEYLLAEAPADCAAPGDVTWLALDTLAGDVPPAGSDPIGVTLDSTGLAPGIYTAVICVASNDPDEPLIPIPVTLEVAAAEPEIDLSPLALASQQLPDTVVVLGLDIANLGDGQLDYSLAEAPADCAAPGDVTWLALDTLAGDVPPAGSDPIGVTLDSTGLAPGIYTAVICVASNDVDEPLLAVPVTLEVLMPTVAPEIPAAGPWGLALLGAGLALAAARALGRRRIG